MNSVLKKVTPIILSVIGSAGVVATAALTAKETCKTYGKISEYKSKDISKDQKKKLAKDIVKCYIPAIAVGSMTIASITAGTIISKKMEASLSATCIALDQGFRKYKGKVKNILGLEKHADILESLSKEDDSPKETLEDGRELYWNEYLGYFYAKPVDVVSATYNMNMRLNAANASGMIKEDEVGFCTLEQFIEDSKAEILDPEDKYQNFKGFGWSLHYLLDMWDDNWIYLGERSTKSESDVPYKIVYFNTAEPIYSPHEWVYPNYSYTKYAKDSVVYDSEQDKIEHDIEKEMSKEGK